MTKAYCICFVSLVWMCSSFDARALDIKYFADFKKLPQHTHKPVKKHTKDSSGEEVTSLATLSAVLGTNDPVFRLVASRIVKGAVGVVGGAITGNPVGIAKGAAQAVSGIVNGTKVLTYYDRIRKRNVNEYDNMIHLDPNRPANCTGFVCP